MHNKKKMFTIFLYANERNYKKNLVENIFVTVDLLTLSSAFILRFRYSRRLEQSSR